MSDTQPLGIEMTEADITELRDSGELRFGYHMNDGQHFEIHLFYDGDGGDDDDDDGSGYRVTTTLQ